MNIFSKTHLSTSRSGKLFFKGLFMGILAYILFLLIPQVLAQEIGLGLDEFAGATNLGTQVDLIGLIARIINIILGFLGIIAIGLILYAGFIWMTSKGDAQKIAKAKKIMAGAVIGLAIILSAFAIANFIIKQFQNATGGGGGTGYLCPDGTPPPCTGFGGGNYLQVIGKYPTDNRVALCTAVQAGFNNTVDWNTVNFTNFAITEAVSGEVYNSGTLQPGVNSPNISFKHNTDSEFKPNTRYKVTLRAGSNGLMSTPTGDPPVPLQLKTNHVWYFTTGTESDDTAPTVVMHLPGDGESEVCRAASVQVRFSEPMLFTSFAGNVELLDVEANATILLSSPVPSMGYTVATFYPVDTAGNRINLDANREYRVTLRGVGPGGTSTNGGIQDACGIPMEGDKVWSFTTGERTDCLPFINSVVPEVGRYEQQIRLTGGSNLGLGGEVYINNFPADANSFINTVPADNILCWNGYPAALCSSGQVLFRVPVGATTGPFYDQSPGNYLAQIGEVHVNSGGYNSNQLDFTITSPYINWVSPNRGGRGQLITIAGWNFGNVPGAVRFIRDGAIVQTVTNDETCVNWWQDTKIVVKVPETLPPPGPNTYYQIQIVTATSGSNGGQKPSNYENYQLTTDPPGPGICEIEPDYSPILALPISVTVTGEKFSSTQGNLTFGNLNAAITSWTDTEIIANTPEGGTPPVNLLGPGNWQVRATVSGRTSNAVNFNVGTDDNIYPRVIDYAGCAGGRKQSPSPYYNPGRDACGNAPISASFNVSMDASTFIAGAVGAPGVTIGVAECGNGNDPSATCTPYTDGFGAMYHLHDSENNVIGFYVYPTKAWQKDYWYKITIVDGPDGVKSAAGNPMRQPYTWQFRVASDICPLQKVDMDPKPYTFYGLNQQKEFSALPTAGNCNMIRPWDYAWTWSRVNHPDDPPPPFRIRLDNPLTKNWQAVVISSDYTPIGKAAMVTASADGEGKSGSSNVTVKRPSTIFPQVVRYNACPAGGLTQSPSPWENSTNACGNAAVSARFTMAMVPSSLNVSSTGTIRVQNCGPGGNTPPTSCMGAFLGFGVTTHLPNTAGDIIGFKAFPMGGFTVGNWYKVTIISGPPGTGVQATNGNSLTQDFVWYFKVASDNCPVSNILIAPPNAYLRNLGDTADFVAMPVAANCNIIDDNKYTWDWTAANHPDDTGPQRISLAYVNSNAVVTALDYTPKTPPRPARAIASIPAENKSAISNVYVSGTFCTEDYDCPCGGGYTTCVSGNCQPKILNIEPDNGAAGSWVTISGCYFGSDKGRILYYNNVEGIWPDSKICGPNTWTNTQVIIETPPNLTPTGPITLLRPDGGRTDSLQNYTYNSILRPGLCRLVPTFNYESELDTPAATIVLSGKSFGASRNLGDPADNVNYYSYNPVTRNYTYKGSAVNYISWADTEVNTITPATAVSVGSNQIKINKGNEYSNPVAYTIRKGSPVPPAEVLPRITGVQPMPGATNICRNTTVIIQFDRPVTNNTIRGGEFELRTFSPGCIGEAPAGWKKWLADLFKFILPVKADVYSCVAQGSLRASGNTIIFTPNQPLAPSATYAAKITSPRVDCINSGGLCNWQFTTGSDICRIHSVSITPPNFTFTSPGQIRSFIAQALAIDGQPLAANYNWELQDTENVVDWRDPMQDLSVPNVDVRANNKNGEAILLATAEYNNPPYSSSATGRAPLRVFLCEEPWEFDISDYDTRLLYCRGRTGDPNLLPAFVGALGPVSGDLLRQYIFKHPTADEVIGLRIYSNPQRLSPREWYQSRPDIRQGNPTAVKIDGYDSLRDPQTVYVGAVARNNNNFYTNIYVLSYSQGASAQTVNIYNQLVKEWIFNIDLDNDSQAKIQRDLVRLADFINLRGKLAGYAAKNGNKYPTLPAGTFLPYRSTSAWSSWQAELGNALGSAIPVDPINKFNGCPDGYNPNTCWNPAAPKTPVDQRFVCPEGSHIYQYSIGQGASGYALRANMEVKGVNWMGNPVINIGTSDACNSYIYEAGNFIIIQEDEDLVFDGGSSGWPPLNEPNLLAMKSITNSEATLVWTTALPPNSNENFSYQVWQTPDVPGFSPDPNGWGVVSGADSIYTQYFTIDPPTDGKWWYKIRAVSNESDNQSESQPVMIIKDSTPPNNPVCIPGDGDYSAAQKITCTATDQGDFKTTVNVHFTNGDVIPSCGSPIISNPASINTTTTLNVIACDAANNASSVVTYTYNISSVVPKANLSIMAQDSGGASLAGVGVSIDGREIGNTPITTAVNLGSRSVNFADNLACYKFSGDINPPQPMNVTGDATVVGIFVATIPSMVSSPSPANEAKAVDISSALSWSVAPCSTKYQVYFGTSQLAVQNATTTSPEYRGEIDSAKYSPPSLQYNTTYYWRVDSVNDAGITKGNVWSFTTATEPTATIKFISQDSGGKTLTGAFARLGGVFVGATETTRSVTYGSYTASFDNNLACYNFVSLSPIQPMNINGDVNVVGTYSQLPPSNTTKPSPEDNATNILINTGSVTWSAGGCTDSFDIYFGTDEDQILTADNKSSLYKGNSKLPAWTIDLKELAYSTTYYWRIDALSSAGITKGEVWSFTTQPQPMVTLTLRAQDDIGTPINGATVKVDATLYSGLTPTSATVTQGSHNVTYDNTLSCYTHSGVVNPTQPRNYTTDTIVTGIYERTVSGKVGSPTPTNGATGIGLRPTLTWTAATCADTYRVYFGTSANPTTLVDTLTSPPFSYTHPTDLNYSTTYYWRVDTVNKGRVTTGDVFSFTTAALPTYQVNIRSIDDVGNEFTGAPVTVNTSPAFNGSTPATATVPQGNYSVGFGTVACYTFTSFINPPQPMNFTSNTTVTGTYNRSNPGQVTSVGSSPTNGATGIGLRPTLTWTAATCADTYRVYFGTSANPTTLVDTLTSPPFSYTHPTDLNYSTTYYWRVDTVNKGRVTTGQVLSFTTQPPPTVTVNFQAKDDKGNNITGITATINTTPPFSGTTPTSTSVTTGMTYQAGFIDNPSDCYLFDSITPPQPMVYNTNTTVTGNFIYGIPSKPVYTYPANGQTNLYPAQTLQWQAASCTNYYHVFLGTDYDGVLNATVGSPYYKATTTHPSVSAFTGPLAYGITYYWRIDAYNSSTVKTTKGDVWSFTTQPPPLVTITIQARDNFGATITGATARLDGNYLGLTQTSTQVDKDTYHTITFDNTLLCYNYASTSPPQGMTYSNNTTVIGTFNIQPPGQAINPNPANGSNANNNPTLSWQSGGCTNSFNIYLGSSPSTLTYQGTTTNTSFSTGTLATGATYYWRIDSNNSSGTTTTGQIWSFVAGLPTLSIIAQDELDILMGGIAVYIDSIFMGLTYSYTPFMQPVTLGEHLVGFQYIYNCYTYLQTIPIQPMNVTGNTNVIVKYQPHNTIHNANPVFPLNGSSNISVQQLVDQGLKFTLSCGVTYFDIYFGSDPLNLNFVGTYSRSSLPSLTFYPGLLNKNSTYYWRVDTRNINSQIMGQLWSFTTEP